MNVSPEMVIGKNTVAQTTALKEKIKMLPQVNQEIVPQFNETTITSRDIASLTNKDHKHVKRDIETALGKDATRFGRIYKDSMNRDQSEYVLPKNIALGIVSGYSFELRMKIINRLEELEASKTVPQFQLPNFNDPIESARAWADAKESEQKAINTIKAKDEVILAIADLNIKAGDVSIGDFSKNLAIEELGRNNMFSWLKARGFLMMSNEPYQAYVARGYFVRKPTEKRIHGEVKYTTMLTAKGTVWLTKILRAEYNLDEAKSA